MSATELERAEALATIALLHEELAEAQRNRDSYRRLWNLAKDELDLWLLAKEELAARTLELDAAQRRIAELEAEVKDLKSVIEEIR